MGWHARAVIGGEIVLLGTGGMVEAWLPFSSGWLWAAVTSVGLLIALEWLVHKRIISALARLWSIHANRRLGGLHDAIRHELECIERAEGSEFMRAVGRGALAQKLKKLKIPCPHPSPQYEATWRIFLASLLICSSQGNVGKARTILDDLHAHMIENARAE